MLFLLTALAVGVADQLTKWWIRSYPEGYIVFHANFFRIIHITNTGASFGFLPGQNMLLTIVACIGITLILLIVFVFSRRLAFLNTARYRFVLGLIMGGSAGNLIDRLRFGQVTDFIAVGIWPLFNVADSSITIGVTLFAYLFLISGGVEKPAAR